MKLFVEETGDKLVSLIVKLMQIQDLVVVTVDPASDEGKKVTKKSLTGRLPILETPEGMLIAESLPIARYLARDHPTFLGSTAAERAQVDMWTDFVNQNVATGAKKVTDMVFGFTMCDVRSFSISLNEFKGCLGSLNEHLALRNFLVGYQMTLADALLVSTLGLCFETVLDKKTRDGQIQNLTRYTTLILKMAPCARVFGSLVYCKDVIQPNFNLEKPKEDKKKAAQDGGAKGKDAAGAGDKKGADKGKQGAKK